MTVHLTDAQLKGFVTGTASPDDVLTADDHLAGCAACRKLAASLVQRDAKAIGALVQALVPADLHLTDGEVQAYVAGRLDASTRTRIDAHLADCGTCRGQIEDLRAWVARGTVSGTATTHAPSRSAVRWYALAASILFAIVLTGGYWWMSRPRVDSIASRLPSLPGLAGLPMEAQLRVRSALSSGTVDLPRDVADLAGPPDTLMGRIKPPALSVIAPVATAVTDDRPVFTWESREAADAYELAILDDRGQVVARSVVQEETARPDGALPRGRVYTWQVTARSGARQVTAPAAPEPVARFKVIDEETASVLQRLEREHADSHVLLGILYLQAGVVDDALRHLRAVDAKDPCAPLARRALEQLGAVR